MPYGSIDLDFLKQIQKIFDEKQISIGHRGVKFERPALREKRFIRTKKDLAFDAVEPERIIYAVGDVAKPGALSGPAKILLRQRKIEPDVWREIRHFQKVQDVIAPGMAEYELNVRIASGDVPIIQRLPIRLVQCVDNAYLRLRSPNAARDKLRRITFSARVVLQQRPRATESPGSNVFHGEKQSRSVLKRKCSIVC